MKNIFFSFLLVSSVSAFAAQTSSNQFTVQLEYNRHTNTKDLQVVVRESCEAFSILGDTGCTVDNNQVIARKDSDNVFYVPGFKFKSKTTGYLVSSYEMDTNIILTNKDNKLWVDLYNGISDKKNFDLTDKLTKHFSEPLYVTTIPAFDFKSAGELKSSKVTNSKIKPENIWLTLNYSLLNDKDQVVRTIKSASINSSDDQGLKISKADQVAIATMEKPSSLKVELNFNVKYFGKEKSIKKIFSFSDLDNIDFASKINEVKVEIEDEDLE
jgi:hypothetical protein